MVPQKVVHSICNFIISGKMRTTKLLFSFSGKGSSQREPNQENQVFDKLESTFLDSSHGHCGRVCRSIYCSDGRALLLSAFHAESA